MDPEILTEAIADGIFQGFYMIVASLLTGIALVLAAFVLVEFGFGVTRWVKRRRKARTAEEAIKELDAGDRVDASAVRNKEAK